MIGQATINQSSVVFFQKRTSYQILVSTDIVSVLEGLQLYYDSHGHLTSDSCECFFVKADIALWLGVSGRTPRCILKCCCRLSQRLLGDGGQKSHEWWRWRETFIPAMYYLFLLLEIAEAVAEANIHFYPLKMERL